MRTSCATKADIAAVVIAIQLMVQAGGAAAVDDKTRVTANKVIELDRAALHAQAVEESLTPVRPGIPGKQPFWNANANAFMYAPAFDFKPVKGATSYRFTVTAYGTKSWSFDAADPKASLEPVWGNLPVGSLLVEAVPLDAKGNVRWARENLRPGRWFVKEGGTGKAPSFDFEPRKNAARYRFMVWAASSLVFEADTPWASLSPIWKDVPVGEVVLKVEGLEKKGGKPMGLATVVRSPQGRDRSFRQFQRKAVFNGPYHKAAAGYTDSAYTWLRWLADGEFKRWNQQGNPKRLSGYPSKFVAAAISGMTALAAMETDPRRKREDLRMADNAARTLIAGSFPGDWGLAYFPPTYSDTINVVMTKYPASVGMAYLDYYEATRDPQILEAAKRIADTYKKTQLASGSWPLRMDGRTGEAISPNEAEMVPDGVLQFAERLIEKHGLREYREIAEGAWRWIKEDTLATFRFEGQFEDTSRGGGRRWNLSHYPAANIAAYLLRHSANDPSYIAIGEEALRFAEDQFVIWDHAADTDARRDRLPGVSLGPWVLEQYAYMVPITGSAANMMDAYAAAFEATGKELYLAKAITFANAMTVILKKNGGKYVGAFWNSDRPGGWPNVHQYSARALARLDETLRRRNLRVAVPEGGTAAGR